MPLEILKLQLKSSTVSMFRGAIREPAVHVSVLPFIDPEASADSVKSFVQAP